MASSTVVIKKGFDLCGVRTARKLRLQDVWKKSHVPYATLARVEHGEAVEIEKDDAQRLAKVLGVTMPTLTNPSKQLIVREREVFNSQRGMGRRSVDPERLQRVVSSRKVQGVKVRVESRK